MKDWRDSTVDKSTYLACNLGSILEPYQKWPLNRLTGARLEHAGGEKKFKTKQLNE